MIPHETANSFLISVYRGGLRQAKAGLAERVKTGDKIARKLLNAVGLFEQGVQHGSVRVEDLTSENSDRKYRPAEVAGQIQFVLEKREKALLVDRLACDVIESGLPVEDAIETLN